MAHTIRAVLRGRRSGGWLIALALLPSLGAAEEPARMIKLGIIGLDTSHVIAFTKEINDPAATGDLAEIEIVAAFPGGSPDLPASSDRVEGYTDQLRQQGIEICGSIPELLGKVDGVLLESVDGRPHLEQVKPVLAAGKPVFIDKPVAGSLADAIAIFRLARAQGVPCFSSSSLRFSSGIRGMRDDPRVGAVLGCEAHSPCTIEPHHPDLFWYGVHGVEMLFTIMGTGCQSVTRVHAEGVDVVTGAWRGGRVGVYRGIRAGKADYGATVYGTQGIAQSGSYEGYRPLVLEIARFFKTHEPPVSADETIEIFAFMEAADESKRQGGIPVTLESVIRRAEATLETGR